MSENFTADNLRALMTEHEMTSDRVADLCELKTRMVNACIAGTRSMSAAAWELLILRLQVMSAQDMVDVQQIKRGMP